MKTKIEWCDYSLNPVKGLCPVGCSYCYARRMYKRFKWNPEIRWDEKCLIDLEKIKKPSRIFVGSTMELFGDWVGFNTVNYILNYIKDYPQHTFIWLTKKPEVMSQYIFPENCWVGVSVCNQDTANESIPLLMNIEANKRFVSIEPMLGVVDLTKIVFGHYLPENKPYYVNAFEDRYIFGDEEGDIELHKLDWVIIGQQTPPSKKTEPRIEWIREIVEAADEAKIPVFLKNNLLPLINVPDDLGSNYHLLYYDEKAGYHKLRQEFPK